MTNLLKTTRTASRGVFCNRTLNLRSIRAVGYDMDYTLVHYNVDEWERSVYRYLKEFFMKLGWPVGDLVFDTTLICRGLIIDADRGNVIKANRFGFVKHAMHGTRTLDYDEQRDLYARTIVDLSDSRWVFLNTLFSLSEGCMYMQLVDLMDQRMLPGILGYKDLYAKVRDATNATHMEGRLKSEVTSNPEKFVVLDPQTALTLLDQKNAGKKLMLITNSEWSYAVSMMGYCFDRFLPEGTTWRELFDVVIVGARKPEFFTTSNPFFEVVTEQGYLAPAVGELKSHTAYLGGSARELERQLKLSGDEILYVGDHMFGDVRVTKNVLRWRTALVLQELEEEIEGAEGFLSEEKKLIDLMERKVKLEDESCAWKLSLQRLRASYGPKVGFSAEEVQAKIAAIRTQMETLDQQIGPLARASAELNNPHWGLLMQAGNDKSHLAFQIERYADIYTSRVSNMLADTPYAYLRSQRGSMPHSDSLGAGRPISPQG